jgi:hypothetical protein
MSSFQHIIPSTPPLIPQVDQYRVVHHTLYHTTTINKYIIFIIFLYSFIYSAARFLSTCAQLSLTIPYFHSNLFHITALSYNHNPSNIPQVDSLPVADDICSRLPLTKLCNIYPWSEGHLSFIPQVNNLRLAAYFIIIDADIWTILTYYLHIV